ncbi:class II glutamine amidotransferase [Rugosimonospora africana]|uniref:Glutamine amidotransferase n=1 Tax=Rugosimonospora africana TaxID=556532 RepID=A0A8J3QUA4_9ACTN|nr:class II glutamine amidotransferase [Rugosimonospora africana]GIH16132.1 hypothetical protein Raf01_43040 [Rugosimonospora africana]
MCLLTFLPAGVAPDLDALHNGASCNNHGHGFAIVTDRGILVQRDLHADVLIEQFAQARRAHPQVPALFHSRFATHGDRTLDNCHPFAVSGDQRTVLAHNGILPWEVQPDQGDRRSDTRITCEDFLPRFGSLRLARHRLALQRWMGPDNKMVLLTVDRHYRQRAYILNENAGVWDGGIWYSNADYLPDRGYSTPADDGWGDPLWTGADWEDSTRCRHCWAQVYVSDLHCPICGCCTDCGQPAEACLCWTPTAGLPH